MKRPLLPSLTIAALCATVELPAQSAAPAASIRDIDGNQFVLVARRDGIIAIEAGRRHAIALRKDGYQSWCLIVECHIVAPRWLQLVRDQG